MGILSVNDVRTKSEELPKVRLPEFGGECFVLAINSVELFAVERIRSQARIASAKKEVPADEPEELDRPRKPKEPKAKEPKAKSEVKIEYSDDQLSELHEIGGKVCLDCCVGEDGKPILTAAAVRRLSFSTRMEVVHAAFSYFEIQSEHEERVKNSESPS